MYSRLEELEALYAVSEQNISQAKAFSQKRKSYLRRGIDLLLELKLFALFFAVVFSLFFLFTNAKLVMFTIQDTFWEDLEIQEAKAHFSADQQNAPALHKETTSIKELEEKFKQIQKELPQKVAIAAPLEDFLAKKKHAHELNYNILPPDKRIIIPSLGINVPLIDVQVKGKGDFDEGNFHEELTQGVVKYPTTPEPWAKGNTLIFGHSSTEWRAKNPYGFVFRNIPKLKAGQQFQVVRNGQLISYEMVERKVLHPKKINEYYSEFNEKEGSYLTLMGCYPIGTTDKRMMIVWKKIS